MNRLPQLARCDPKYLDVITWAVMSGVRMFQRVQVTPNGLQAIDRIPEFDFGCIVPTKSTLSALNVMDSTSIQFPLKCSPASASEMLPWWSDMSWASFCFVSYLTRAMLTGAPRPIQMYLDVLPPCDSSMAMAQVAAMSQKTKEYQDVVAPLLQSCRVNSVEEFNGAFRMAYCLFRRHALPFWSGAGGFGHPYYATTRLIQKNPQCDLLGFVPIVDLATHSDKPNMTVGIPDAEMLSWLGQEKGVKLDRESGYFVLQATRDIEVGEMLTVDKNAFFNFDEPTFEAWFGYPYQTSPSPAAVATPTSTAGEQSSDPAAAAAAGHLLPDDLFGDAGGAAAPNPVPPSC
jgi:hypothetical protein